VKIVADIINYLRPQATVPRRPGRGLGTWLALLAGAGLLIAAPAAAQTPTSIVNSKHNLAIGGPGPVRSPTESDVCIFCHAPHGASTDGPLWNHAMSVASYTPYSSSTLKATVGQPTGASKLCLSCHDGTVALGMIFSRPVPIPMPSGALSIPPGPSLIGTDLSSHHPVSFLYDSPLVSINGELRNPNTLVRAVRLDQTGNLQCTSCHDPHNNQFGQFLVEDNTASALCQECHVPKYWDASIHASSQATWNGVGQNPWPHTSQTTVAANACENCHTPHAAQTPKRLLNFTPDEQNCLSCHSGTVANKSIADEFNKISVHPVVMTSGQHDPAEDIINSPRHVACEDCHNPHATRPAIALAPAAPGALTAVRGVTGGGGEVRELQNEFELCFRCHGDSPNRGPALVQRQFVQTNTRLQFNPGNTSFHPVEVIGKNPDVPSLLTPLSTASLVYCTDCHNNDQGPNAGGTGPNGPHGSVYEPLLERMLLLTDGLPYNPANFALCYKCHSSSVVDSASLTSWQFHQEHIEGNKPGGQPTACTTCHDSHASSQPHLINFNTTYVTPSSSGGISYVSTGMNHGNCTLTCHGKDHAATPY
jgi:predicted CXXCH cytochrome family protein